MHARRLDRYTRTFASVLPPHNLDIDPFCTRLGRCTRAPFFSSFRCRVSFGLYSSRLSGRSFFSWMFPLFVVFFRVVCWSLCLASLFASACSVCPCVSGVFGSVCFLCGVFVVRVRVGLWLLLLSLPRLSCSSLLWVCGLLRLGSLSPGFVLPCPARPLSWSSGAFWSTVFCLSLPLGIWLCLRRLGCHACGMVCCDGFALHSSWQQRSSCVFGLLFPS